MVRYTTLMACILLGGTLAPLHAQSTAGQIYSEREINGTADLLKGAALDSVVLATQKIFQARADYYEKAAKAAYSFFGKANAGGIPDAERKALQSYYSTLSKSYRAASTNQAKALNLLKLGTDNFKVMGKQIPSKFKGVPINANPLAVILSAAEVGFGEYERVQLQKDYPNVALTTSPFEISTEFAKSLLNGLTFGAFAVVNTSFGPHDVMPSDTKGKKQWLNDMESDAKFWTNDARAAEGNENYTPAGILQYLKVRQASSKELLDEFGIPMGDDQFSWIDDWSLARNGAALTATRNGAVTPKVNYSEYVPYPAQTGWVKQTIQLSGSAREGDVPVSYTATNPNADLTNEQVAEILAAADPDEFPALPESWAGRVSLSGRADAGLNPATGVVEGIATSQNAPVNNAIQFSPDAGSLSSPINGVQENAAGAHSFNHLIWGGWTGGSRIWTTSGYSVSDLSGFFVYGKLTPPPARTTGTAAYTGRLRGDMIEQGGVIQRGLAYGDFGLTANFGTGALGGWLAIAGDDSTNYVFVSDIDNAQIVRQRDNLHFYGDLGNDDVNVSGRIEGYFFGPNATEIGGTYAVASTDGEGSSHGILLGWETGTIPDRPVGTGSGGDGRTLIVGYHAETNGYGTAWSEGDTEGGNTISYSDSGNGSVTKTQALPADGYSYVAWGEWASNATTRPELGPSGNWVDVTSVTPPSVIQNRTGTAHYSGNIVGGYVSNGVRDDARGLIDLNADFSNQTVSGQFQFGHDCSGSGSGASGCSSVSSMATFSEPINDYDGSGFGNHAHVGNSGVIGVFGGPDAQEIGGTAWLDENNGMYIGVFRATQ